ncbi:MAG: hypothetical protein GEU97_17410 [Actinophytocola sp.]|nr:hypothetical protein [Actinophytocola sp.]
MWDYAHGGADAGIAIPPQLTLRTLAGMARHPGWVAQILTTGRTGVRRPRVLGVRHPGSR